MAKDDETGIDPVARDGEPKDDGFEGESDELARRRKQGEKDEAAVTGNGGSARDRADAAELAGGEEVPTAEEDDGQLFVWEQGRRVTLGTLIARGTPVEHAFVFGGKRLKGRGQLMGFEEDSLVVGRGLVSKTSVVPTRDEDEKVTKATIETHLAMKVIVPADSAEAEGLLAAVLERRGYRKTAAA